MMASLVYSLILSCLIYSAVGAQNWSNKASDKIAEEYLKKLESSKYDPRVTPEGTNGPGTPIEVSVSMYFLDINKVDDYNMDFSTQFYFRQLWNDSRLQFKDSNLTTISLRSVDEIWTPDLFFVEEKKGMLHEIIHPNMFCKINSAGEVHYSVKLSTVLKCPMDLRKYPHDAQKCYMSIESYGFQRKNMELKWLEGNYDAISVSSSITSAEFEVQEITKTTEYAKLSTGEYGRLQVQLLFKRKAGFFVTKLYLPFIILVLFACLSLWINSDQRCFRLVLLLVILYLMTTVSSEVNLSIPPTSYIKAIDIWIGFCGFIVFAAFLEFIAINLISTKKLNEDSGKSEILILEPSEKDLSSDSLKSPLSKLMNMIDVRKPHQGNENTFPCRVDRICRLLFLIIFIIFNVVYWSVFCKA